MSYVVYDEDGEVMRVVGRREEALCLVAFRKGWTMKYAPKPKKQIDLSQFEEALF
jgi:hypothetical protein